MTQDKSIEGLEDEIKKWKDIASRAHGIVTEATYLLDALANKAQLDDLTSRIKNAPPEKARSMLTTSIVLCRTAHEIDWQIEVFKLKQTEYFKVNSQMLCFSERMELRDGGTRFQNDLFDKFPKPKDKVMDDLRGMHIHLKRLAEQTDSFSALSKPTNESESDSESDSDGTDREVVVTGLSFEEEAETNFPDEPVIPNLPLP